MPVKLSKSHSTLEKPPHENATAEETNRAVAGARLRIGFGLVCSMVFGAAFSDFILSFAEREASDRLGNSY